MDSIICSLGKKTPELKDLYKYVVEWWAPQWRQLGTELGIGHNLMDIIDYNYPKNCEECCRKMLTIWLKRCTTASWDNVIAAVDNLITCGRYSIGVLNCNVGPS